MTDTQLEKLEDYAKLQDVLMLFEQALETGEKPTILPTFNDAWNEEVVSTIFDMIAAARGGVDINEE